MNIENDIKVSVCVVTYNQENYIAECLESLVTQQTSFKFEIIVGEDCSTDTTRAIVQSYVEKHPNLIVPLFYKENVGAVENIKQVYKKAKGKYIAHMDGDDMALPGKLQQQFDVLEENIDCNICTHNAFRVDINNNIMGTHIEYPEGKYTLLNLFQKFPFFTHSTKMFRNKYSHEFWDNLLKTSNIFDSDVHIENAIDGHIYHINNKLGKYRVGSGITNKNGKYNSLFVDAQVRGYERGMQIFYQDVNSLKIVKYHYALSMLQQAYNYAVYDKDVKKFNYYVDKSVDIKFIGFKQIIFKIATIFPHIFFYLFELRNRRRSK